MTTFDINSKTNQRNWIKNLNRELKSMYFGQRKPHKG